MKPLPRLILLLAFILRLPGIFAPMWFDEQFSLILARLNTYSLLNATAWDVHPPLSYLIFQPWANIGLPEWAIRIPSLIASMLGMVLMLAIMRRLSLPERVQVSALFLMAINPFELYHANEARMYAIFQAIILLAFLMALERQWFIFTALAITACYTLNYGPIYMASIALVAIQRNRADWKPITLAGIVTVLTYIPWLTVMVKQSQYLDSIGYWIPGTHPGMVLLYVFKLLGGMINSLDYTAIWMYIIDLWLILATGWFVINRPQNWISILIMASAPILLAWLVSVAFMPILLHRPLIATIPFWLIILAYPIEWLVTQPRRVQLATAIFIVPALLATTGLYVFTVDRSRSDPASAKVLEYIQDNWKPGDVAYHELDQTALYFKAYAPDLPSISWLTCQPVGAYINPMAKKYMGMQQSSGIPAQAKRVWMIQAEFPYSPTCERNIWKDFTLNAKRIMTVSEDVMLGTEVTLYLLENAQ